MDRLRGIVGSETPIRGAADSRSNAARRTSPARTSFHEALQREINAPVKLSAHAETRLRSSRIQLSEADMTKLNGAVNKAAAKGARESLVLLGDLALVVSVKNRTVITAVTPDRLKESVFTNIDSAVIT